MQKKKPKTETEALEIEQHCLEYKAMVSSILEDMKKIMFNSIDVRIAGGSPMHTIRATLDYMDNMILGGHENCAHAHDEDGTE